MADDKIIGVMRQAGLRDTQPRRLVVEALRKAKKPLSPLEIRKAISARGQAINAVSVYRILEVLERHKLLHRHPCDGGVTLCSMPEMPGHHGFLHCVSCGEVEEFASHELCKVEDEVASKARFTAHSHLAELKGICIRCKS
jgi:Fe2+ or Zn2+ uptake regulation protein